MGQNLGLELQGAIGLVVKTWPTKREIVVSSLRTTTLCTQSTPSQTPANRD